MLNHLAKLGRNDPCPCGSGVKYKRCCLPKDEAERRAAAEPENDDDRMARRMLAFIEPLVQQGNQTPEAFEKALMFGAMCWELALLGSDETREEALTDHMNELWKERPDVSEEVRSTFRRLALSMVERHREMFPELHGMDAR